MVFSLSRLPFASRKGRATCAVDGSGVPVPAGVHSKVRRVGLRDPAVGDRDARYANGCACCIGCCYTHPCCTCTVLAFAAAHCGRAQARTENVPSSYALRAWKPMHVSTVIMIRMFPGMVIRLSYRFTRRAESLIYSEDEHDVALCERITLHTMTPRAAVTARGMVCYSSATARYSAE